MIRSTFFSIGFRPFFASGVLFASVAFFIWAAFWQLDTHNILMTNTNVFGGFLFWHPHELIMGFALAIIMGFLLTAARNWTGLETAGPTGLFILWFFWLLARAVMAFGSNLPFLVILSFQIIVPLLGAMFIARPIIQKKMWRNLFAPCILVLFALIDSAMLYQIQNTGMIPSQLLHANILLIIVIITMIGGRIIPLFTANKLGIKKSDEPKAVFFTALIPLIALIIATLFTHTPLTDTIITACATLLFIAHSLRLKAWFHKGILKQPMLWSLWGFYAALPLGFLIMAIAPLLENWIVVGSIPVHILAVGGICGLIISMVSRVSLGHTGRIITHDKYIVAAFVLLITSLLVRTLLIALMGLNTHLIITSAILAGLSCLVIFVRFIAIWLTPRPDQMQ